MAMEFWGVEVKNGESLEVDPGEDMVLRISQAALGESKNKGNEPVYIYLTVDNQKFTIGTLNQEKFPQMSAEIVLEKRFKLSHSWKHGSVFFAGYRVDTSDTDADDYSEDDHPIANDNEKRMPNANQAKPNVKKADAAKSSGTKQVNFMVPNKEAEAKAKQDEDDSNEDSEDDTSFSEDSDDDEDKKVNVGKENVGEDDDDDDNDEESDDESSDEETPKKPEPNKKRPAEAAPPKMPTSEKKAKFATPQKTEVKQSSVHIATPHPAKQTGKKPGNGEASKQQTPKSGGSFQCKSCNRSFTSEGGLQSHSKAKHGAAA